MRPTQVQGRGEQTSSLREKVFRSGRACMTKNSVVPISWKYNLTQLPEVRSKEKSTRKQEKINKF